MTQKKLEIIGPYTPEHEGPFCTREGKLVELITRNGRGGYPILGYAGDSSDIYSWTASGGYFQEPSDARPEDLMNAREVPVAREFWVNRCASGSVSVYLSEEIAQRFKYAGCEIIHVREVLPGEDK